MRRILQLVLLLAIALLPPAAIAQTVQYRHLSVAGRLTITVPSHWHVRDLNERRNIAASADASQDPHGRSAEPMHVSSLSVVSTVEKPQVILRVSFVAEPGSQQDLLLDLRRGKVAAIAELAQSYKQAVPTMEQIAAQQGGKYLGDEHFDFVQLGGKMAMLISYRRASLTGGAPFRVDQFHVPMGGDKILITVSVQESAAALMTPIVERIKNSIAILQ